MDIDTRLIIETRFPCGCEFRYANCATEKRTAAELAVALDMMYVAELNKHQCAVSGVQYAR